MEKNKLLKMFTDAAENGTLSHAYILEGEKNGGKEELAYSFAQKLTPYHEDITTIKSDGKTVKDEAVLSLQERLSLKPMAGDLNIGIIEDADTMTLRAQNRLLKTLEEPRGGAVILLLSENRANLLPTILSRCVVRRVDDEELEEQGFEVGEMEQRAATVGEMLLGNNSFYAFSKVLDLITKERDSALAFLEALEAWYRDVLVAAASDEPKGRWMKDERMRRWISLIEPQKAYGAVKLIEEAKNDILRNVNAGYTIKNLILKI